MKLLRVRGRGGRPANGPRRRASRVDLEHLAQFAATRTGVEAYLEPETALTETTIVLVAGSGEWTRRRVGDVAAARKFSQKAAVPLYDVAVTNYPPRMRAWTARRKAAGEIGPPGLRGPSV